MKMTSQLHLHITGDVEHIAPYWPGSVQMYDQDFFFNKRGETYRLRKIQNTAYVRRGTILSGCCFTIRSDFLRDF